jgi:glycosyltransferase involved in cell wall biosynthesis
MSRPSKSFVLVLSGKQRDALDFVRRRYPDGDCVILSKTELREGGWKFQLRRLRKLSGRALVIFADSLESIQDPVLLKWATLFHRCRETVLADSHGSFEVTTRAGLLRLLPRTLIAALSDFFVFVFTWIGLQVFRLLLKFLRKPEARDGLLDVAFLCPSRTGLDSPGGALTHVTGFLSGLAQEGVRTAVFSGRPLSASCDVHLIPGTHRLHLFREAAALSYNIQFIAAARRLLTQGRARLLYQRHGKFLFAGAVLSRLMGIPLILEYNASETWMAKHWDPASFSPWLRLCENASIRAASLIVVVSNPLKEELMNLGVPAERILVNPNAVDPESFYPDCGGAELRHNYGFRSDDVVVCFVGTFSYWHGVAVLEQAIRFLLDNPLTAAGQLKFLLVGDGPLAQPMRIALEPYARRGLVLFTGTIQHHAVRQHLDAADILVSPHVPMPDGGAFFGSPTKLFEYMAMGKAIAASALDQIAEVLEHERSALLCAPGDPESLAEAIQRLAADAQLRVELGRNARTTVLARHTWRQNARRVLAHYSSVPSTSAETRPRAASVAKSSSSSSVNLAERNLS